MFNIESACGELDIDVIFCFVFEQHLDLACPVYNFIIGWQFCISLLSFLKLQFQNVDLMFSQTISGGQNILNRTCQTWGLVWDVSQREQRFLYHLVNSREMLTTNWTCMSFSLDCYDFLTTSYSVGLILCPLWQSVCKLVHKPEARVE